MSEKLPSPASNTFERIKRLNVEGNEFWSVRELARVLEYTDFRNFITVITKALEACATSEQKVSDHFVDITEMVGIGCGVNHKSKLMARLAWAGCVAGFPGTAALHKHFISPWNRLVFHLTKKLTYT